jgi:hypothetical protein
MLFPQLLLLVVVEMQEPQRLKITPQRQYPLQDLLQLQMRRYLARIEIVAMTLRDFL